MRTITYNENIDLQRIYQATLGGSLFSSNHASSVAFDFFANNAQVGDALYFGFDSPRIPFGDITVNVGTPIACSSITLVWEYSTSARTWATLAVTDNTNSFRNAGQNAIQFMIPANFGYILVNGIYCDWVRCRITAVEGITEGGAQANQKIQVRSRAIIISDPGNTVTNFCQELHAASVAGGWGVVSKIGTVSYHIAAHVFLGYPADAAPTNISDTLKHIECDGVVWGRKGGARITLGNLVSDINRTSNDGCVWKFTRLLSESFSGSSEERWELYSSTIDSGAPYGISKMYNSIHNDSPYFSSQNNGDGVLVANAQFQKVRPDFIRQSILANALIKNIRVSGSSYAMRMEFQAFVRELVNVDCPYIGDWGNDASLNYDVVLIDPVSATYNLWWAKIPTSRGAVVSRNYTYVCQVLDSAGSPVEGMRIYLQRFDNNNATGVLAGRLTNNPGLIGTGFTCDSNVWALGDYARIGAETVRIVAGVYPNYTMARAQLGSLASSQSSQPVIQLKSGVLTDASGATGEIVVETNRYKWLSGMQPGITQAIDLGPFRVIMRKYGFTFTNVSQSITAPVKTIVTVDSNPFISATESTAAAYTGIAIDGAAKAITLTAPHTMQELYDYTQWWAAQSANMQYDEPITTTDGSTFTSGYSLTIDGVALTGSGALNLGSNTLTMANGGSSILNITAADGTHTIIQLTGLEPGSRVQLYDLTADSELFNDVVAGASLVLPVVWTADHTLRVRIMWVSGASAKRWFETTSVLTANGMSLIVAQNDDPVYNLIALDGSTVSECSIVGTDLIIDVDDPDNTTTGQRLYAFEVWWLSTEAGIRDQALYIEATDATHFVFEGGLQIRNAKADPLQITGANIVPAYGPATAVMDMTGGPIFLNFNRVEGFAYMTQGGLLADERAKLLAIPSTPLLTDDNRLTALNNLDVPVSSLPGVSDIREELDSNSLRLAEIVAAIPANAITPDQVWQCLIDQGYSAEQVFRLMASALLGKASGANSSEMRFRDLADTKDRIVATVDQYGNRAAVTLDAD